MQNRLKRWLYLIHRWLGITACAFFAMWFISGVVMMYIGYPKLTERERLQHLPALDAPAGLLAPREALDAAGMTGKLADLRLSNARGGQPVYMVTPVGEAPSTGTADRGRHASGTIVIDAKSGSRLQAVDQTLAMASAAAYDGQGTAMWYMGTVEEDAFTHSRALDRHRPLHVIQLDDAERTRLYVSGKTGEVVRDATLTERIWNFAGAWIHWLYPFRGNLFDAYWTDIVIWLSIAGTFLAITGTAVGMMRWRFSRPYRSGSRSPYQNGFMRWHHLTGLVFGLITITWIFSGLMSMNPWRIFNSGAPSLQVDRMHGGPLTISSQDLPPAALLLASERPVSELRWTNALAATAVAVHAATGAPVLLDSRTARPRILDEENILAAARTLLDYPVLSVVRLERYDLHYYSREPHTMGGGSDKPLPILRVAFDDPHRTWVHIDPHTGAVLGRTDSHRRTSRWLFAMLHSWDWLPLLERHPLWDMLLIALSLGGTALSITGVVIGWRRLSKNLEKRYGNA